MAKKGVSRRGFLKLFGIVPAAPKIIKGFLESPVDEVEFDSSACKVEPSDVVLDDRSNLVVPSPCPTPWGHNVPYNLGGSAMSYQVPMNSGSYIGPPGAFVLSDPDED